MLLIVEFFVFVSLLTYCALKWLKYYKVPNNFPPGPPSVPVLGVLPFIRVSVLLVTMLFSPPNFMNASD